MSKPSLPILAPAGSAILLVCFGYWGKGATLAQAMDNLQAHSHRLKGDERIGVYVADESVRVDDFGRIWVKRGELAEFGIVTATRIRRLCREASSTR